MPMEDHQSGGKDGSESVYLFGWVAAPAPIHEIGEAAHRQLTRHLCRYPRFVEINRHAVYLCKSNAVLIFDPLSRQVRVHSLCTNRNYC
jgi:hypothetical protein